MALPTSLRSGNNDKSKKPLNNDSDPFSDEEAPDLADDDPLANQSVLSRGIVPAMPAAAAEVMHHNEVDKSGYRPVGRLTFEDVMSHDFEKDYLPLEPAILSVTERIQKDIIANGHVDESAAARGGDMSAKGRMTRYVDSRVVGAMGELGISVAPHHTAIIAARCVNEITGSGPLEPLLENPKATEIMVSGIRKVYIEMNGKMQKVPGVGFRNAAHALELAQRILQISQRALTEKAPLADGRLLDLSRFNAVHPGVTKDGPYLTIRRQRDEIWTVQELVQRNSMSPEIAAELVNLIYSGCTTVIVGGTGTGKALNVNTLIPTPTDFVRMGDLKVGDLVLDENGQPTRITGVYDQGIRPTFDVALTDGTCINADSEHNWLTYNRAARRSMSRRKTVHTDGTSLSVTTLEELRQWKSGLTTGETLSVKDVTDRFPNLVYRARTSAKGLEVTREGSRNHFDGVALLENIIRAGLLPARSQQKRWTEPRVRTTSEIAQELYTESGHVNYSIPVIPEAIEYPPVEGVSLRDAYESGKALLQRLPAPSLLTGSIEQRRALLAGFADHYGKMSGINGTISIPLGSNKEISRYAHSVALSLGMQANLRNTKGSEETSDYTLQIRTKDSIFTPETTKSKMHLLSSASLVVPAYRYIESITPAEDAEMRCISVNSDSRLFLCGTEYVVTHNTTVLNALSGAIPSNDAIITIEDNFELKLHPERNVRAVEARPANATGEGEVTIRDLVKNALRMRPERIVVGEVRGAEAFDMLQALNTGHEGSMTTFHANGPDEGIDRLASMTAQSGEVDKNSAMSLIASGVDLMLTIDRYDDGSRRVSGIYEIPATPEVIGGTLLTLSPIPIWEFNHEINLEDNTVRGDYVRVNEISDRLKKKKRLHVRRPFTIEEAYKISDLGQD